MHRGGEMLKYFVDKIESVDEKHRDFYEKTDTGFRLKVEGAKGDSEITGLTRALEAEREAKRQAEKRLKELESSRDDKGAKKGSDEDSIKAFSEKIKALETQLSEKEKLISSETIGRKFAASKYISEKLILPGDIAQSVFGSRFKVDGLHVVALDAKGNVLYSRKNPAEPAEFEEAIEIMVSEYSQKAKILRAPTVSGSGASRTPGGNVSGWDKMSNRQKLTAARKG
jgi:hypothetical protein